ncbi:glycosyltransferase family 2 protein [Chromohalobacter israelensis]|uniref:glycosyltransferase family 2 protein n=1 Tax=Chromohalobacter israelensis TaxID=141390 RepID=UPI000FFF53B7|nr:glycosyltransferase family 2 protein [Chromohalobacter salexigens]RXE48163.1 hypothetical protein B4O83_09330 [Chromohalobacter salexigens]
MKYKVNPVSIPNDVALRRQPHPKDGVISEEQLQNFDNKSVFYDVFIDPDVDELVGIGPPALNVKPYVEGITVWVNGRQIRFSFVDYPEHKVCLLKARVPHAERYEVVLEFSDATHEMTLLRDPLRDPSRDLSRNSAAPGRKVLTAISKNNAVEWVDEWIDFYKTNYGIDDVFIYDNGSDNLEALEARVGEKANIVSWNFPFGPTAKRFSSFAQPVALNHCLKRFAKGGVLFNFDIDELLVADHDRIMQVVSRHKVVYFESHNVPYVNPGKRDYSFRDFRYRYPERKKTARKFVCDADANFLISPHNTWVKKNYFLASRLKRNKPDALVDTESYFLHFLGITTNWQPGLNKLKEVTTDGLVKDESHIRMMPVG